MDKFTKLLKGLTVCLSLALVGLLVLSNRLDKEMEALNKAVNLSTSVAEVIQKPSQPIGVLLLGIDSRDGGFEESRSDAIIVASVNPERETTELITIPRDTLVEMDKVGGNLDKINHSYMFGGVDGTIQTVSNYLDIPIHYVVEINMQGMEDLIDAIGGIMLTPTISFTDEGHTFTEGEPTLMDGHKALTYSRMRKQDPRGDVGRGERQQEVLHALSNELVSGDVLSNYNNVLSVVKGNMRTNATISAGLIRDYLPALKTVNSHTVNTYQDMMVNKVYYLGLEESERVRLANVLRGNLGLNNTTTDKQYILDNALQGVMSGYSVNINNGEEGSLEELEEFGNDQINETYPEVLDEHELEDEIELFYGGEFSVDPNDSGEVYTGDDFNN